MGAACSSTKDVKVSDTRPKEEAPAPEPFRVWKIFPTISEAKGFYKADGTFDQWVDPGHLELRTLLDEPTGQHSLGGKGFKGCIFCVFCGMVFASKVCFFATN